MLGYIARRLATVPLTLLLVIFVAFVVLRITGDPVEIYLDVNATPEQRELLREQLGLDQPIIVQFGYFLGDVVRGDFGRSLQFSQDALPVVLSRIGPTLELISVALLIALVFGIAGGVFAAIRKDRLPDFLISGIAVVGQSMPSFWLGILLIQFFALQLHWLPTSGSGGWRHLILPSVTLAFFLLPNFILITRTAYLETVNELFVTTGRSKGMSNARLIVRHVLPNAMNPVVSFLGLQMGRLMGGSIITETIFAWPGIGTLMVKSIFQRDVPVVIAAVFVVSIAIILANLLVDIVQSLIDPRIRLD